MPDKAKLDDPAQSKRFIEMAKEINAGESPEAFEHAFQELSKQRTLLRPRVDEDEK